MLIAWLLAHSNKQHVSTLQPGRLHIQAQTSLSHVKIISGRNELQLCKVCRTRNCNSLDFKAFLNIRVMVVSIRKSVGFIVDPSQNEIRPGV